ncbi:MAG: hypothetical protein WCR42_07700 [bacterium]
MARRGHRFSRLTQNFVCSKLKADITLIYIILVILNEVKNPSSK